MKKWKAIARRAGQPARFWGKANPCVPAVAFPARPGSLTDGPNKALLLLRHLDDLPPANERSRSIADWIQLIRETCWRSVGNALELARLMSQARRSLPYGGWSRFWQSGRVPFSKRKGEMLVVIGECVEGLDAQNSAHLPAAWNTLYCLARMGRAVVGRLIQQGRIHPALTLRQAQGLLAEHLPGTRRRAAGSKLKIRLARLAAFIRGQMESWTRQEQDFVSHQLLGLAGEIQSCVKDAPFQEPGIRPSNGPSLDQAHSISRRPRTCSISLSKP